MGSSGQTNLKILWAAGKETTPKVRNRASLPRYLCHGAQKRGEKSSQTRWGFSCLWKEFLPDMTVAAMAEARRCLLDDHVSCGSRCPKETADNYTFSFLFHVWQPDAFLICSVHLSMYTCVHICIFMYNLRSITLAESQMTYLSF